MPTDPTAVADRLAVGGTAGLIAGLVFAIIALFVGYQTGVIVQGWLYKQVRAECASWQKLAEGQGEKLERLTALSEAQALRLERMEGKVEGNTQRLETHGPKLDRLLILGETNPRRAR